MNGVVLVHTDIIHHHLQFRGQFGQFRLETMGQFQAAVLDPGQEYTGFIKISLADLQGDTGQLAGDSVAVQKQGFEG